MRKIHDPASLMTKTCEQQDKVTEKDCKFKCDICEKTGKHKLSMSRHVETHIEGLSFPCNLCGKVNKSRHLLQQHLSREHRYKN